MPTSKASSSSPIPQPAGFLRVRLLAGSVSVLALVATGVLALAALFSHQSALGMVALASLIICVFANGVIQTWRGYFLWRSGVWADLSGQRLTREQQPARFMIWLAMHLLFAMIWMGAAGYLTWTLLRRL